MPVDPKTSKLVSTTDVEAQALQALTNMKAIVDASGSSLNKVAKTLVRRLTYVALVDALILNSYKVFLKDMNDFAKVNAVYAKFFGDHRPARSCVEVARLPFDILFEIECVAVVE